MNGCSQLTAGRVLTLLVSLLMALSVRPAHGAELPKMTFDLPAETAEVSLKRFATQSGVEVLFTTEAVARARTAAVKGAHTPAEALRRMLAGTGLVARQDESTGMFLVRRADSAESPKAQAAPRADAASARSAALLVKGTGTIVGRVLNSTNHLYLHKAKISIKELGIETFTNEDGEYSLANVPPGEAKITAFYTGLDLQSASVLVAPGRASQQDFSLNSAGSAEGAPLQLDEYIVAENRQMNAQAIAINEQRFAPNLKNVVSTDEYGDIGESNIGEIVKYIPGLSINYAGGRLAASISARGFPPYATMVTIEGNDVASAGSSGPNRSFDVDVYPALNNIARVEVTKSPTPDMPAQILGAAVNLIGKSAFEHTRRELSLRAYATANSRTATTGTREDSRGNESTSSPIGTGLDFSAVFPIRRSG
jgi:hypothetical protein